MIVKELSALVDTGARDSIVNASTLLAVDTAKLSADTTNSTSRHEQCGGRRNLAIFDIGGVTFQEPVQYW